MKKWFIFLALMIFFQSSFPQRPKPPGTIRLNDSLFMDKSEIRNIDWKEYMYFIKRDSVRKGDFQKSIPDSASWSETYGGTIFGNPYVDLYPVSGITYEQAIAYGEWRSEVVNKMHKIKHPNSSYTYHYRLADTSEFRAAVLANSGKKVYPLKENSKYAQANHVPEKLRKKNYFFQISDNLAEITSIKGIAFGTNYINRENLIQTYAKAEGWLGIRYVCEVRYEKKKGK